MMRKRNLPKPAYPDKLTSCINGFINYTLLEMHVTPEKFAKHVMKMKVVLSGAEFSLVGGVTLTEEEHAQVEEVERSTQHLLPWVSSACTKVERAL